MFSIEALQLRINQPSGKSTIKIQLSSAGIKKEEEEGMDRVEKGRGENQRKT